jgi:hypothetical protein
VEELDLVKAVSSLEENVRRLAVGTALTTPSTEPPPQDPESKRLSGMRDQHLANSSASSSVALYISEGGGSNSYLSRDEYDDRLIARTRAGLLRYGRRHAQRPRSIVLEGSAISPYITRKLLKVRLLDG